MKGSILTFTLAGLLLTVSCTADKGKETVLETEKEKADTAVVEAVQTGKIYYVSPAGKDSNPGTQEAPLATIAAAASKAEAGDTVKIGPGLYREQITFRKSGKEGAPITFLGTRGKDGEYLSIVEAPGVTLDNWGPAPEIAPEIWKTPLAERPDVMLMDGKMIALIFQKRMDLPRLKKELPHEIDWPRLADAWGPKCRRLPGFDLMSLSKDAVSLVHLENRHHKVPFWPVIGNVIAGWSKGYMYIRFADGDEPRNHKFTATRGNGFVLENASHLVFRDLHLRGSRIQFHLTGKSSHNTIESCLLMHGGIRIRIEETASFTTVENCILTLGFIRSDLFKLRSHEDMRGGLLYHIFKYIIAGSLSDDVGVRDIGHHTRIAGNVFLQGLIAMQCRGVDCEVRDNVVREMSSCGIVTGPTTVGIFTGNLVENCGIPLRIHRLRGAHARREEYHFRNLYIQDAHAGTQVFVHCESHRMPGPDLVNYEKGTSIYKQDPPDPVDPGKIYIYHNTFWGGYDDGWICAFNVRRLSNIFRTVMPFFVVNNIYKDNRILGVKTHELAGPNLLYVFDKTVSVRPRVEPDVDKVNKVLDAEASQKIWNKNDLPGLPDLTLAPDSPALGCGIDVSKPFTVNGKQYPAFPGFQPGYFKGNAPAAGAFQAGESQEKFIRMHCKAEKISEMLKGAVKP